MVCTTFKYCLRIVNQRFYYYIYYFHWVTRVKSRHLYSKKSWRKNTLFVATAESWIFKLRCHCRCRESLDDHRHRSFSAADDSRYWQWHRDLEIQLRSMWYLHKKFKNFRHFKVKRESVGLFIGSYFPGCLRTNGWSQSLSFKTISPAKNRKKIIWNWQDKNYLYDQESALIIILWVKARKRSFRFLRIITSMDEGLF